MKPVASIAARPLSGSGCVPDPIDIHVGRRVKLRRVLMRIRQEDLAADIGVTCQQLKKYESGGNRVSASRLYDISRVLDCPTSYFFDDINGEEMALRAMPRARGLQSGEGALPAEDSPMQRTETLQLARAYWRLNNETLRRNVLSLVENMGLRN